MTAMRLLLLLVVFVLSERASACINDSFTSETVLSQSAPDALRRAVRGEVPAGPDRMAVERKREALLADPHPQDIRWANELAGAYLRLDQPQAAADLLEPLRSKHPDDYGLHANFGTACHLLGRYAEAAAEIERDLEIDPQAHGGLEVYHLALLQYLAKPAWWQDSHLFIDEWTPEFLEINGMNPFPVKAGNRLMDGRPLASGEEAYPDTSIAGSKPPAYRYKFFIANERQIDGAVYMLNLNQKQPCCFAMAGFLALLERDAALAKEAFAKAIALNSPQSRQLKAISELIDVRMKRYRDEKIDRVKRRLGNGIMIAAVVALLMLLIRTISGRAGRATSDAPRG